MFISLETEPFAICFPMAIYSKCTQASFFPWGPQHVRNGRLYTLVPARKTLHDLWK